MSKCLRRTLPFALILAVAPSFSKGAVAGTPVDESFVKHEDVPCAVFQCGTVHSAVESGTDNAFKSAGSPLPPSLGTKRILLYRVDFSDAVGSAISSNVASTLISDLNNYYRDMSFGLMGFAPPESGSVVTETLRLPEPSSAYDNNFQKFINAVRQVATTAGHAPSLFDFDIICTGSKPSMVFGGIAFVGGPGMWIPNGNFSIGVVGHELGHNLGLPHSSFWFTGDVSTTGPGVRQEYGDPFDSMGVPGGSSSHFNTRFKHFLGWLSDTDVPLVASNGTYRLTAHDHTSATGLRGLRLQRGDGLNYWVEFRQSFNNRWVTNGASLRWSWSDRTNTVLLDTTPGSVSLTQDSPVVIGRTFSDRCYDLHITPVGKGGTTPESLDVVINRGPFPNNLPPTVSISANETNVAAGATVTLTATASDQNGDALAYYWDFGDGNFGSNQSSIQNSWALAGEFVVRCIVTDMKGGTAGASILVRVGNVTTFTVSGRITRPDGTPLEGVLVRAGARLSYTDSDGTYRVSRLGASRPTVSATTERLNILNAGFENPVSLGPSATGLNLIALPETLNGITLVNAGSVWRYLETGIPPGAQWTALDYNDSAWAEGPAKLGYGIGDETTQLGFGPNPLDRPITIWFRHRFTVERKQDVEHLVFRLRRDDGAVVYLNGHEVYRENLPAGPIQPTTTAIVDVLAAEEQTFWRRLIAPTHLVSGTNILAVEIHQVRTNSPDLSFDLDLVGLSDDSDAFRPPLTIQRLTTNLLLTWPGAFPGWSAYGTRELGGPDLWTRSTAAPFLTNGLSAVFASPTNQAVFYQLRKQDFCTPFQ